MASARARVVSSRLRFRLPCSWRANRIMMKIEKTSNGPSAPTINRVKNECIDSGRVNQRLNWGSGDAMNIVNRRAVVGTLTETGIAAPQRRWRPAPIFGLDAAVSRLLARENN